MQPHTVCTQVSGLAIRALPGLPCCCVQERDQALAALECVRADLRTRDDTITQLTSELEAACSQNTSLRGEVEELGRMREELIDRVERLHAEKHKLEDRVAQAEQHAQVRAGKGGEGWRERAWIKKRLNYVCHDMCCVTLFISLFPLIQSLLSGDFDDLLTESLDASSVKEERGQVRERDKTDETEKMKLKRRGGGGGKGGGGGGGEGGGGRRRKDR